MKILRIALTVVSILAFLTGIVWIGQGTGVFPYPPDSMMINQMPWTYRGIGLVAGGLVLILVSRLLRRR